MCYLLPDISGFAFSLVSLILNTGCQHEEIRSPNKGAYRHLLKLRSHAYVHFNIGTIRHPWGLLHAGMCMGLSLSLSLCLCLCLPLSFSLSLRMSSLICLPGAVMGAQGSLRLDPWSVLIRLAFRYGSDTHSLTWLETQAPPHHLPSSSLILFL